MVKRYHQVGLMTILLLEKNKIYLIKSHSLNRKLTFNAYAIFYTYRDIRECLLSFKLKFGIEPSIELCDSQINQYLFLKNKAVFFKYENLIENMELQITYILKRLNIQMKTEEVIKRLPELQKSDIISDGYDPITLMHSQHGTHMRKNSWKEELDKKLIQQIEQKYKWWFIENDYQL